MKLVTVSEMQAIEREANASGVTYEMMMENAGLGLAHVIQEIYGYLESQGALGLVGSGNNGGDTLVALAALSVQGWPAAAYIVRPRPIDDPLILRLLQAGGQVFYSTEDPHMEQLADLLENFAVLLDGILGTGMRLPLKEEIARLLVFTSAQLALLEEPPVVIAVDCPSGIDCDTGEAAPECLAAEITVTMAAVKQGLLKFPAYQLVGELRVVGIGLLEDGETLSAWRAVTCGVVDEESVQTMIPPRPLDAHKGSFGTTLVVAGSLNYTGAAYLAGMAAYRVGTGLVTLAVPAPLHSALAGQFPEATWLLLPNSEGGIASGSEKILIAYFPNVSSLLVGPGFGLAAETEKFLSRLFSEETRTSLPALVIDADGLKLLARLPGWPQRLPGTAVLTPHPGEMAVLTGLPKEEIQSDRLAVARRFSHEWGHVVVLKGAFTIIAAPDGQSAIIPVATPALARAGTGDVLAGLIAGLRAQKVEAFPSAVAGAWIHAQAGLQAARRLGSSACVLAGDVLQACVDVIAELEG